MWSRRCWWQLRLGVPENCRFKSSFVSSCCSLLKKLRKNRSNWNKNSKRSNRKSEDDTTSEDESDRPKKTFTPRPNLYCWCHGTQKTHSSPECKVMAAETDEFTPAMRKSTKSTSPPEGSTNMYGRKNWSSGEGSPVERHLPPPPDRKFDPSAQTKT